MYFSSKLLLYTLNLDASTVIFTISTAESFTPFDINKLFKAVEITILIDGFLDINQIEGPFIEVFDQEGLHILDAHAQAEAKEKNYGAPDGRLGQPFFDRGRRGAGGCLHGERCPIFLERGYNKLYVVFESDRRKGWTHVKVSKEIPSELVAEGYLLFVFSWDLPISVSEVKL